MKAPVISILSTFVISILIMLISTGCGSGGAKFEEALALCKENYGDARFESAVEACTDAVELADDSGEPYLYRAQAYQALENYDAALADYNSAVRLAPKEAELYRKRAELHKLMGNARAEADDYTRAIALSPDDPELYAARAASYGEAGEIQPALKDYDRAIGLAPDDPVLYNDRAFIYVKAEDYGAALEDYDMAIELEPDYVMAYRNRAVVLSSLGRADDAVADMETYIQKIQKVTEPLTQENVVLDKKLLSALYVNKAEQEAGKGNHETAIEKYGRAIELREETIDFELQPSEAASAGDSPREELAMLYIDRAYEYITVLDFESAAGDYTEAIDLALKELDFREARVHELEQELEGLSKEDEEYTVAEMSLKEAKEKAEEMSSVVAAAYSNRGFSRLQMGMYDDALLDYDNAIELAPEKAASYNGRAQVYEKLGDTDAALADYTKALDIAPTFTKTFRDRAALYEKLGEYDAAINDLEMYLRLTLNTEINEETREEVEKKLEELKGRQ